jgi:hypothetical protein
VSTAPGPVIIVGVDRSGLALLAEVLAASPDLLLSRRTGLWFGPGSRTGDLRDPDAFRRYLHTIGQDPRIAELAPDLDEILEQLRGRCPTPARVFAALQEQRCRRVGARRWGDKSHGAEAHADEILEELPAATVVHLVRDPRDRYASQALHRSRPRGGAGSAAALWLWSVRWAERNRRRHGAQRYLVVRYETLVSAPAETVAEICAGLGEPVEALAGSWTRIHPGSVGRYRRDLHPREVAVIEALCRRPMRRFGYEPQARLGLPGRVRLVLVDLPAAAVAVAAWYLRRLRRRAPRRRSSRLSRWHRRRAEVGCAERRGRPPGALQPQRHQPADHLG